MPVTEQAREPGRRAPQNSTRGYPDARLLHALPGVAATLFAHRSGGVSDQADVEALSPGVQRGRRHAYVLGQAAYPEA